MTGSVDKTITKSFLIAFCLNCRGLKIPKKLLLQTKSQLKRELHLCIGVHKTAFVCSRLLHLCALDFCIRAQPTFIFAMPVSPWKWMSRKYCSVLMLFHCIPNSLLDHGLIFDSRCRKSISFCTEPFDHWTNNLELQQGLEPQEFDFTYPDDDDHTCFLWRFSRLHFSILSWNIRFDVITTSCYWWQRGFWWHILPWIPFAPLSRNIAALFPRNTLTLGSRYLKDYK